MTEKVINELDSIHQLVIEADKFIANQNNLGSNSTKFEWLKKQIECPSWKNGKDTQIIYYHIVSNDKVILQNKVIKYSVIKNSEFYKEFIKGH